MPPDTCLLRASDARGTATGCDVVTARSFSAAGATVVCRASAPWRSIHDCVSIANRLLRKDRGLAYPSALPCCSSERVSAWTMTPPRWRDASPRGPAHVSRACVWWGTRLEASSAPKCGQDNVIPLNVTNRGTTLLSSPQPSRQGDVALPRPLRRPNPVAPSCARPQLRPNRLLTIRLHGATPTGCKGGKHSLAAAVLTPRRGVSQRQMLNRTTRLSGARARSSDKVGHLVLLERLCR